MISLALLAAAACSAGGMPDGAVRLEEQVILDKQLSAPETPAPYASVLVPAGWRSEGGVEWMEGDPCGSRWRLQWVARSPDGKAEIGFVPGDAWTVSQHAPQFSSCPSRPYGDAASHLEKIVGAIGGLLGETRERPDIAALFEPLSAEWRKTGGEVRVSAIEAAFAAPPREQCGPSRYGLAVGVVSVMRPAMGIPENEDRAAAETSMLYVGEGPIDPRLMEAIRASVKGYPGWAETVSRITQNWNDPYRKRIIAPVDWSKPKRPGGEKRAMCGGEAEAVGVNVWRTSDGAYFFLPPENAPEMLAPPSAGMLAEDCAPR